MANESNSNPDKYNLSFIGADLALSGSIKIADVYLQLKDWDAVKEEVYSENILQTRTKTTEQRIYGELSHRLQELSEQQVELLVDGTLEEQKQLLWFAICERYSFVREFAVEVIHEKYLSLDYELTDFDFNAYFNRKADWHGELDEIKDSTRKKLKEIIYRILKQADLVSEDSMIIAPILSNRFVEIVAPDTPDTFRIFPILISDIQR